MPEAAPDSRRGWDRRDLGLVLLWSLTLPGPGADVSAAVIGGLVTYGTYGIGHPLVFSVWLPVVAGFISARTSLWAASGITRLARRIGAGGARPDATLADGEPARPRGKVSAPRAVPDEVAWLALATLGLLTAFSFNAVLGLALAGAALGDRWSARPILLRRGGVVTRRGLWLAWIPITAVGFHLLSTASGGWGKEALVIGAAAFGVTLVRAYPRQGLGAKARGSPRLAGPARWVLRWAPALIGAVAVALAVVFERRRFATAWQFVAATWMVLAPWVGRIPRQRFRVAGLGVCGVAGVAVAPLIPWSDLRGAALWVTALVTASILFRPWRLRAPPTARVTEVLWGAPLVAMLAIAFPKSSVGDPRREVLDRIVGGFETYGLLWDERLGRLHFTSKDEPWIGSLDPLDGRVVDRIGTEVFHPQRMSLSTDGTWLVVGGLSGVYRTRADALRCWVQLQRGNNVDVAVSRGDVAFVGHESRSRIDTFDLRTGESAFLDLGPLALCSRRIGGWIEIGTVMPGVCRFPYAIEYDRERDDIFVGDYLAGLLLSRTDASTGRTETATRGYMNLGMVPDLRRQLVYVARPYSSRIDVLRAADLSVVAHWDADFGTRELTYGPATDLVLAASFVTGRVRAIDAATGVTAVVYEHVPKLRAVAVDERDGYVLAGGAGGVYRASLPADRAQRARGTLDPTVTPSLGDSDPSCVHQSTPELPRS